MVFTSFLPKQKGRKENFKTPVFSGYDRLDLIRSSSDPHTTYSLLIRILNIQTCADRPCFEIGGFKKFQQTAINIH